PKIGGWLPEPREHEARRIGLRLCPPCCECNNALLEGLAMRVGLGIPYTKPDGSSFTVRELMERARVTAEAGFDGIWAHDQVGRGITRPDPFTWLIAAAAGSDELELGF